MCTSVKPAFHGDRPPRRQTIRPHSTATVTQANPQDCRAHLRRRSRHHRLQASTPAISPRTLRDVPFSCSLALCHAPTVSLPSWRGWATTLILSTRMPNTEAEKHTICCATRFTSLSWSAARPDITPPLLPRRRAPPSPSRASLIA
eukprot:3112768-Pleurochrysis_carterae.AAC.1